MFKVGENQCDQMLNWKVAQFSAKVDQKVATAVFYLKVMFTTNPQKIPNIWATFARKFVAQTFKNSPIWSHWKEYLFAVIPFHFSRSNTVKGFAVLLDTVSPKKLRQSLIYRHHQCDQIDGCNFFSIFGHCHWNSPKSIKITKVGKIFCQLLNKLAKPSQRLLKFGQSDEIWPNVVTLVTVYGLTVI